MFLQAKYFDLPGLIDLINFGAFNGSRRNPAVVIIYVHVARGNKIRRKIAKKSSRKSKAKAEAIVEKEKQKENKK